MKIDREEEVYVGQTAKIHPRSLAPSDTSPISVHIAPWRPSTWRNRPPLYAETIKTLLTLGARGSSDEPLRCILVHALVLSFRPFRRRQQTKRPIPLPQRLIYGCVGSPFKA